MTTIYVPLLLNFLSLHSRNFLPNFAFGKLLLIASVTCTLFLTFASNPLATTFK
jgi:hypothetical protein